MNQNETIGNVASPFDGCLFIHSFNHSVWFEETRNQIIQLSTTIERLGGGGGVGLGGGREEAGDKFTVTQQKQDLQSNYRYLCTSISELRKEEDSVAISINDS